MCHSLRLLWLPALLLAAGISPTHAAPVPKDDAPSSVPFPGGVADPAAKTAYVTNTAGGIDAIDLGKGDLLWDTKEPAKPVAVAGKKLVVQVPVAGKANEVKVAILDTAAKGKKVSESDAVTFPDWVSVGGGYGRSFASSGRIHDGALLLTWQARAWYAGGARPSREIEERARKQDAGIAKVNLESGKVEMLPADKAPAATTLPKELEKVTSQQYWTGSDWQKKPLVAGKVAAALDVKDLGGGKAVMTLKRWGPGQRQGGGGGQAAGGQGAVAAGFRRRPPPPRPPGAGQGTAPRRGLRLVGLRPGDGPAGGETPLRGPAHGSGRSRAAPLLPGERAAQVRPGTDGAAALGEGRRSRNGQAGVGAAHRGGEDTAAAAVNIRCLTDPLLGSPIGLGYLLADPEPPARAGRPRADPPPDRLTPSRPRPPLRRGRPRTFRHASALPRLRPRLGRRPPLPHF